MVTGAVVETGSGRGLEGVAVSDGRSVVATGADGRFALDLAGDAEFVMLTVPATHRALEPGWFAPAAAVADRHTFELVPRDRPPAPTVRFLHVTDLHLSLDGGARLRQLLEAGVPTPAGLDPITGAVGEDDVRADLVEAVRREAPEFVAATGDLADHGEPGELAAYLRVAGGLGVPVAHVPGNHDYLSSLDQDAVMRFLEWLRTDGRDRMGEPYAAFQEWMYGGDWQRPDSGRRPWVQGVGPAYYSFDWGPAHFVVYDSESRLRYGDRYPQDEWLAADLALVPSGKPVVALLHFAEPVSFWDERFGGTRLIASFAGHWHANRRLAHGGAVHYVSANVGFAGYDHSARGYRAVEVGGEGVQTQWQPAEEAPRRRPPAGTLWEAPLPGLPTIGRPALAGDMVVVSTETPDSSGVLVALDAATGAQRWRHGEPSAVVHSPIVAGDAVVAVSVTGALVALDAATGTERWRAQLGDPGVRWCFGAPAVVGDSVVAGGSGHVACLSVADGTEHWARTDLAPDDWPTAWGSPVAAGATVVVAFANERVHLCALDAATGETRWSTRGHELTAPCSSPIVAGDRVVATTVNGWLTAWSLSGGERLWSAALAGPWPVATPALDAAGEPHLGRRPRRCRRLDPRRGAGRPGPPPVRPAGRGPPGLARGRRRVRLGRGVGRPARVRRQRQGDRAARRRPRRAVLVVACAGRPHPVRRDWRGHPRRPPRGGAVRADLVVVGAGPAGSAAAIAAARGGLDVVVVDKAHFPRDKTCGDGLTTAALRALERLGLRPDAVPSWRAVDGVWLRSPSGQTSTWPWSTWPERRGPRCTTATR
jgi:3',5'-cyclic AMP phosphodiesterase CpdA